MDFFTSEKPSQENRIRKRMADHDGFMITELPLRPRRGAVVMERDDSDCSSVRTARQRTAHRALWSKSLIAKLCRYSACNPFVFSNRECRVFKVSHCQRERFITQYGVFRMGIAGDFHDKWIHFFTVSPMTWAIISSDISFISNRCR